MLFLWLEIFMLTSQPSGFKLASYKSAVAESQYLIRLLQLSGSISPAPSMQCSSFTEAVCIKQHRSIARNQNPCWYTAPWRVLQVCVHVSRASLRRIMCPPCNSSLSRTNNTHLIRADGFLLVLQCGPCVCVCLPVHCCAHMIIECALRQHPC